MVNIFDLALLKKLGGTKWKLLGESEVTQAMVDEAGSAGVVGLIVDLGKNIEEWYGETWIRLEMPNPNWDADKPLSCNFGISVGDAMSFSETDNNCVIFSAQSPSYGGLFKNVKNIVNLFTNWLDGVPRGTSFQINGFGAKNYPYHEYGTSCTEDSIIYGKRYLALNIRSGATANTPFPVGTKIKLYGRFAE